MIIKVCGLKYRENTLDICNLNIDMAGFNFYELSPRYVHIPLPDLPAHIKKTGVFVNSSMEYIMEKADRYKLEYIQLHGNESISFTEKLSTVLPVIKVFRIDESFNPLSLEVFDFCSYFLFDSATKNFGGSGKKFDWSVLDALQINVPFLLSGGIGPEDAEKIKSIQHPMFKGIDINSKFEISEGLKDVEKVKTFVEQLL